MRDLRTRLDDLRDCLEGAIPCTFATVDADGVPNVTYVSHVEYVDAEHVALTFQFFNKSRRNVLANPHALIRLWNPRTARGHRLRLRYLETRADGPLFERMKAKLAGIASHTGMADVFRLRGSDVYRVISIEVLPGRVLPAPPTPLRLAALHRAAQRLAGCSEMDRLLDEAMSALDEEFAVGHAMLLVADDDAQRLVTLASRGYEAAGIGSEVRIGEGIIGVAARERTPIRVPHFAAEYAYSRAVLERAAAADGQGEPRAAIPLPGLAAPHSQLALPIVIADTLVGVLYVESPQDRRFDHDDEDALGAFALHLGLALTRLQRDSEDAEPPRRLRAQPPVAGGRPMTIRYYRSNHSVFVDDRYVIKGVAGAILAKLLRERRDDGRCEFSNRELRLDRRLPLPEICDNLEARLVLLMRRLREQPEGLCVDKAGRGRLRLSVDRPYVLIESD